MIYTQKTSRQFTHRTQVQMIYTQDTGTDDLHIENRQMIVLIILTQPNTNRLVGPI